MPLSEYLVALRCEIIECFDDVLIGKVLLKIVAVDVVWWKTVGGEEEVLEEKTK